MAHKAMDLKKRRLLVLEYLNNCGKKCADASDDGWPEALPLVC